MTGEKSSWGQAKVARFRADRRDQLNGSLQFLMLTLHLSVRRFILVLVSKTDNTAAPEQLKQQCLNVLLCCLFDFHLT